MPPIQTQLTRRPKKEGIKEEKREKWAWTVDVILERWRKDFHNENKIVYDIYGESPIEMVHRSNCNCLGMLYVCLWAKIKSKQQNYLTENTN